MGMALCPTDALCSFLTLCAQKGNPPDESGKWIQLETTVAVLEALHKLRDICHPDSLYWNPIALYDTMACGDTVVYAPLAFGYINYVQEGFRKHPLAFSDVPDRKGALLGGAGLAISNRVEDPRIAGDYCLWVCGSDCQSTTYLASGGQPGNGAAWTLPSDVPESRYFLNPTRGSMEQAYVRPRFAGWPAFQEELGNRVHAFLRSTDDPVCVHHDLESLYMEAFVTDEIV
jgi:multiple sugar transport system substrate-binding protein